VDPVDQISISNYATFSNNPVLFTDILGDTWKDKSGKELDKDQLNKTKVYIFYDPQPNGKHGGFGEQTMKQVEAYEKQFGEGSVALSASEDTKTIKEDWGNMQGTPNIVAINMHGSNQAIHINADEGQYLSSNETGKTNTSGTPALEIKDLPTAKANLGKATLQLNTCHSNDQYPFKHGSKGSHYTVAEGFRKYHNFDRVRATGLGVSYNDDGTARPQLGSWAWQYLGRSYVPAYDRYLQTRKRFGFK
jgi:hypothetical protein